MFISLLFILSCNSDNSKTDVSLWKGKELTIKSALKRLMKRDNRDCFVIFSEKESGKFVQFTKQKGKLLIDLPEQPLRKHNVLDKAKHFFKQYDSEYKTFEIKSLNGEIVETYSNFDKILDENYDLAFEIAVGVFDHIYGLSPDFEMTIEEN